MSWRSCLAKRKSAKVIDAVTGLILLGLAVYHFSTISATNPAWRSGTIETAFGLLLLASAFLFPRMVSAVANAALAVGIAALGSYHFTHAGMRSGVTQWLLAIALGVAAVNLFKRRA